MRGCQSWIIFILPIILMFSFSVQPSLALIDVEYNSVYDGNSESEYPGEEIDVMITIDPGAADVDRALEKHAERAKRWSDLTEKVIVDTGGSLNEAFILYHLENEALVTNLPEGTKQHLSNPNQHTMTDQCIIKICAYKRGINIKNVRDYATLWDYYKNGKLADLVEMDDPIGEIFAYLEFFPDDENVRKIFTKLYG